MPTESYLKSQRLWIMHKLLMRIEGVRDKIQFLLATDHAGGGSMSPEQQMEIQNLRLKLSCLLLHFQNRLGPAGGGGNGGSAATVFSISEDLTRAVFDFQQANQTVLHQEKQVYVERRCEIIRWCAWCVCNYGKDWMERVEISVLQNGFSQWMSDKSSFLQQPSNNNTKEPRKIQQPDSPAVFKKKK